MITITRITESEYRVDTGNLTADCRPIVDVCDFRQGCLHTAYTKGIIHTVPTIHLKLGSKSLAAVTAMTVGESITF